MATSMQTQPSPILGREPVSPPHHGPEPGSRLAQDAIPYQGPSNRNYKSRFRLMLGILGAILLVSIALTVRVLTDRGLDDSPPTRDQLPGQNAPAQQTVDHGVRANPGTQAPRSEPTEPPR